MAGPRSRKCSAASRAAARRSMIAEEPAPGTSNAETLTTGTPTPARAGRGFAGHPGNDPCPCQPGGSRSGWCWAGARQDTKGPLLRVMGNATDQPAPTPSPYRREPRHSGVFACHAILLCSTQAKPCSGTAQPSVSKRHGAPASGFGRESIYHRRLAVPLTSMQHRRG